MAKGKKGRRFFRVLWHIFEICLVLGLIVLGIVHWHSVKDYPEQKADVIVVLGARVMPGGELSTTLEHRIESAYEAYEKGLSDAFILCGGQGSDEPMSEAVAMAEYLYAKGVPLEKVFLEDQSVNTFENLRNAKAIMEANGMENALLVTSDYHLTRALWLTHDAGVEAIGYPAPGPNLRRNQLWARVKESASWVFFLLKFRVFG